MRKLAIASDHGGFVLKQQLVEAPEEWGIAVDDLGTHDEQSCDYPDYAHRLASAVADGTYEQGILICGTGIGMAVAANKHRGVRAAVVSDTFSARMSREHNDANVLCMGGRVVGAGLARDITKVWLESSPDPSPRHARRVAKIELPPTES